MTWTWDTLTRADGATYKDLMRAGGTPDPQRILGDSFRGLNRGLLPKLTGERFRKVFHTEAGEPVGHNVVDRGGHPVELGWFRVGVTGRAMRFDYNDSRNRGLYLPLRGLKDDVVLPNPGDHDLLLGRARLFGLRVAYFVLERERPG
jgi:hypothetical protein